MLCCCASSANIFSHLDLFTIASTMATSALMCVRATLGRRGTCAVVRARRGCSAVAASPARARVHAREVVCCSGHNRELLSYQASDSGAPPLGWETALGIEGGSDNKLYVCRVHNGAIRYGVLFTRSIGEGGGRRCVVAPVARGTCHHPLEPSAAASMPAPPRRRR